MNARPSLDRAELLSHVTFVRKLSLEAENKLIELVTLTINRFFEGWDAFYSEEMARLYRVQEHIDRALAAIVVEAWTFEGDDDFWPFHDETSAYAWLQGEGENPDSDDPESFFARDNNWKVRSLWNVRQEIDAEIGDLDSWAEARYDLHWTRPPVTTSRLPTKVQEMIHDFCQAWHDLVDEKLGLPRRDPNPSNPLLRYLDCSLKAALGEQRPAPKTVLQLVHDYIRPAIQAEDAENRRQEQERKEFEDKYVVDFDPFPDDLKSPR